MIFNDYLSGMGGRKIAETLRKMDVRRVFGGVWRSERVIEIIKNEKYTGNALLQKKYVADYLSKKLILNKGQLPKYYAEETHPAIIDQETFDRAQVILKKRSVHSKNKNGSCNKYPFSGIIRCGECGKKYKRKVQKGKAAWYCTTFLKEGKAVCPTKQIPEYILYSISTEVLGLDEFSTDTFKNEIAETLVPEPGKLIFVFRDGRTIERTWQHRSRRESWTDEMRETAREREQRRRLSCQQK